MNLCSKINFSRPDNIYSEAKKTFILLKASIFSHYLHLTGVDYNIYDFVLNFVTVRSGYSVIPMALASDLDIKLNTAVKQIHYTAKGVEIQTAPTNSRSPNAGPCTYKGNTAHSLDTQHLCLIRS